MTKKKIVRYVVQWNVAHLRDIYNLDDDWLPLCEFRTRWGAKWWIRTRIPKKNRYRYEVVETTRDN